MTTFLRLFSSGNAVSSVRLMFSAKTLASFGCVDQRSTKDQRILDEEALHVSNHSSGSLKDATAFTARSEAAARLALHAGHVLFVIDELASHRGRSLSPLLRVVLVDGGHGGARSGATVLRILTEGHAVLHAVSAEGEGGEDVSICLQCRLQKIDITGYNNVCVRD